MDSRREEPNKHDAMRVIGDEPLVAAPMEEDLLASEDPVLCSSPNDDSTSAYTHTQHPIYTQCCTFLTAKLILLIGLRGLSQLPSDQSRSVNRIHRGTNARAAPDTQGVIGP